jgi:predicted O-methyltransferase YrrM
VKGRDIVALAADRVFPRRGRACLANGELTLAEAPAQTIDRALHDPVLADAYARLSQSLAEAGFGGVIEATPVSDCRALFHIAAAFAPSHALEIGTHTGASTLHIAAALREAGGGRLTTVDIADVNALDGPWSRYGAPASPAAMLGRLGLEDRVTFVHGRSDHFLAGPGEHFDLVFVDGSHSEVPAFFDIRDALGRLAPGGVILLHDYYPEGAGNPGVRRAVERLRRSAGFVDVRPFASLPWEAFTSLAVISRAARPDRPADVSQVARQEARS